MSAATQEARVSVDHSDSATSASVIPSLGQDTGNHKRVPRSDTRASSDAGLARLEAAHLLLASRGYAVGPAGGSRADPAAFDLSSHLEAGGGGDRRRRPSM